MENASRPFRPAPFRSGFGQMTVHPRQFVWLAIAATAVLVGTVLAYPGFIDWLAIAAPPADENIPTSFSGNRMAYGFALFSLFSTSSLAIRKLIHISFQLRNEDWRSDPDVGLYRMTFAALLIAVIAACGPDVIVLLLWGEAGSRTMETALTFDRICDGLVGLPFTAAILLQVRAEQFQRTPSLAELQHLAPHTDVGSGDRKFFVVEPRKESIAENVKILLIVMAIAAGLALWK